MIKQGFYSLEIAPMSFGEPPVGEIDHLAGQSTAYRRCARAYPDRVYTTLSLRIVAHAGGRWS